MEEEEDQSVEDFAMDWVNFLAERDD